MLVAYQVILVVPKRISKILRMMTNSSNCVTFSTLIVEELKIQEHKWLRHVFALDQDAVTSEVYCNVSR